jgi:hypothetical protein
MSQQSDNQAGARRALAVARTAFLASVLVVFATGSIYAQHSGGAGGGHGSGKGDCPMKGECPMMKSTEPGAGAGQMGGNRQIMRNAMTLVHSRYKIEREVEEVEGGVRTRTRVTGDPELRGVLLTHVKQVAGLIENGGRMRAWDPLFAEIFDHYDEIELKIEEIEDGVLVVETSDNPEVAKLIRAHAYKVNDFLARGHAAVHEETPLPEGYVDHQ